MFGKIEYEKFVETTSMPQKAASAWNTLEDLLGASYKPLLYLGKQQVNGVNYYFIAEQTIVTNPPIRRVVKLAIRESGGEFELLNVEEI